MTPEEMRVIALLGDAFNEFCKLPKYHPQDGLEFCQHIHACQNIVMSRDAVRSHPEIFGKVEDNQSPTK